MNDIERFNCFFSNLEDALNSVRDKVANGTKMQDGRLNKVATFAHQPSIQTFYLASSYSRTAKWQI